MLLLLIGLAITSAPPPAKSKPAGPTSVLIMPIQPRGGVERDLAEQITAWVAVQSARQPGYHVQSYREVEGAMSQEQARQIAGCDELSCAAEIAGALNTDEIVIGGLGLVGDSFVLTLTRIRARDAAVPGRVAERFASRRTEDILDRMPNIVDLLFSGGRAAAAAPAASSAPPEGPYATAQDAAESGPSVPPVVPWVLRGLGGAVVATGVLVLSAAILSTGAGLGVLAYDQLRGTAERHAVPQMAGVFSNVAVVGGVGAVPLALLIAVAGAAVAAASMVLP